MSPEFQEALFQFAGRLHPLVLHLPIGLWLAIAVLEFGGALIRRSPSRATMAVLAWLGALGAAMAVGSGWVLALEGGYGGTSDLWVYAGETVEMHRWLGIGFAGLGLFAAIFAGLRSRTMFRGLLVLVLLAMTLAGHLGSEMTHGKSFLTEPFEKLGQPPEPAPQGAGPGAGATDQDQQAAAPVADVTDVTGAVPAAGPSFATHVLPLLHQRCGKCHGETKQKGELALHTREAIEAGGELGPVFTAGDPAESSLIQRLRLPIDDEDHMPPEGKTQPTAAEIALLTAWIAAGAPWEGTFALDGPPPAKADDAAALQDPAPEVPAPQVPSPRRDEQPEPPPELPRASQPQPTQGTGGGGDTEADDRQARAATPAAPTTPIAGALLAADGRADDPAAGIAAIAALQRRQVHVAELAPGSALLTVDLGPVASTVPGDELHGLLAPLRDRIAELALARTAADDEVLRLCGAMPKLRRLDVRRSSITSAGVLALQDCPALQELVLAQNALDDDAVAPLLAMPALERLYVWNAGLSSEAVARLRARAGLHVDDGQPPSLEPLEQEPEVVFVDELPPPAAAPLATGPAAQPASLLLPTNATCPVSGKPIDARYVIVHDGRALGFCCPNCPKEFWAAPGKFQAP